jgi:predicted  nucleic acid-binding Zn-ribbon protein
MPQRAKLLYALQRIDDQITQKKRRYREVDAHLGESQALKKARAALEKAQKEQIQYRTALRDRELEAASVVSKLAADTERLYSGRITNPRELQDLQQETEYLKRRQAELEEQQFAAMMAAEQAATRAAIINEQYVVTETAWKSENADLHGEYETLRHELAHLLAQRKAVAKRIDGEDLKMYDSIRRLKKGVAVVAVQNGVCRVCHVEVPQRDLTRAAETDELYYCSGCERIMYVPES